jgi:hypothetical protein
MGPVAAPLVVATFFNFNPALVAAAIPAAWDAASPVAVLAARYEAVDRSLRQAWGPGATGADVAEAAGLARRAAERAGSRPEGRPLFAAHASLPWPDEAHLVLWHAQTLLREYRGDAHVALLTVAGLDAVEALVVHAATGQVPAKVLRRSRGWTEGDWAAGTERVRDRGWLEPGPTLRLSPAGQHARQVVEDDTDALSVAPYEALGVDGCSRLRSLARPLADAVIDAGLLAARFPVED